MKKYTFRNNLYNRYLASNFLKAVEKFSEAYIFEDIDEGYDKLTELNLSYQEWILIDVTNGENINFAEEQNRNAELMEKAISRQNVKAIELQITQLTEKLENEKQKYNSISVT